MTREEKSQVIEDLAKKFQEVPYFYIADSSGLTVAEINRFRKMCFEKGIEYRIVKNTLIKKALEKLDTDYTSFDKALKGASGIMFSPESAKAPAKVILEYRKKGTRPAFKAASIESGLYLGEESLHQLSDIKSKDEMIGEIIGLLQSPAKNVISALKSGGAKLAGIVKTLSEREA